MSWAKLDDGWHCHPKIVLLPLEAVALDALAISYVAQNELDGVLQYGIAVYLARGDRADLFDALVSAGRWEKTDTGFVIHNYLKYNPSKAQLAKERKRTQKRVAAYRKRNGVTTRRVTRNTGSGRVGNSSRSPEGGAGETFARFWLAYPRKTAKAAALKAWRALNPDTALLEAMLAALTWQCVSEQWTKDGGEFVPHPATYLNGRRWEDQKPAIRATTKPAKGEPAWKPPDYKTPDQLGLPKAVRT